MPGARGANASWIEVENPARERERKMLCIWVGWVLTMLEPTEGEGWRGTVLVELTPWEPPQNPSAHPRNHLPTFLRAFAASGACLTCEKDKLVCRGITASNETLNQMRGMSQQIKASASLPLGETIQCVLHILIRGPAVRMNPAAHSSESRIDTH